MLQYEPRVPARPRPSAFAGRISLIVLLLSACGSSSTPPPAPAADAAVPSIDAAVPPPDTQPDTGPAPILDAPALMEDVPPPVDDAGVVSETFCTGGVDVPGAIVPGGFCLRRFAGVPTPRTLTFAPNGDLFVGSPSSNTPGGAPAGMGAILVLHDDNKDGVAEVTKFLDSPDVHGLAIGDGYVYFTTANQVWRTPYVAGLRQEKGPREHMNMPITFGMGGRWTHGLARSAGGSLYASRGQYGICGGNPGGEVSKIALGSSTVVTSGFRNPMYLRCHHQDEICAATELGEDQQPGAREKLLSIRTGTNFGYGSCCHGPNVPAGQPPMNCGAITQEEASFVLSHTPFGFDWERDKWPEPYRGAIFVALHGSYYSKPSWEGARIAVARTDPKTRMPTENFLDFVQGFGPQGSVLDRPSDVAFAPDGRMFFADDQGQGVYWIAPTSLTRPN